MSNLNKDLEAISELKNKERVSEKAIQEARKDTTEKMDAIRKRIKAGETTGDRIRDFVIVAHGAPNAEVEKIYSGLEEKIAKHEGEFILLVGRSYEFHGCTGFGHVPEPHEYALETYICLGILNGKKLVFNFKDHASCEIPTSKYARPWGGVREEVKIEEENIKDSTMGVLGLYWSILELGKPAKIVTGLGRSIDPPVDSMDAFNGWKPEKNPKLEIKIGDIEVDEWFKTNKRYEKTYQKMQKALGRIALQTPEMKEKQKQVLKNLANLTQTKRNYILEINETLRFSCQFSEDECGIVTIQLVSPQGFSLESIVFTLNEIEKKLLSELRVALELGLDKIESIKQLAEKYKYALKAE